MKKVLFFFLTLSIVFSTVGCSRASTRHWQTIYLPECGTLKIPEDWRMFEKDDRIYIVDADDQPVMIQVLSWCGIEDGEQGIAESNAYFEDVIPMKCLSSAVFSNSAAYGEVLVSCENIQSTKLFLDLPPSEMFIVWDETVDMEMLITIAKTFVIE